jgi:hypothetical protein
LFGWVIVSRQLHFHFYYLYARYRAFLVSSGFERTLIDDFKLYFVCSKPVIGFNSAPHKSVGRLCLPTWCSNDVKGALHALKEVSI